MTINQRVKQVRQTLNLSQARFAKALSMSNGYIAGIELGHNGVNDRIVKLICFTFHINEGWLKSGEGQMFDEQANPLAEAALVAFQKLKPEFQEYILKQMDQLLDIQRREESKRT